MSAKRHVPGRGLLALVFLLVVGLWIGSIYLTPILAAYFFETRCAPSVAAQSVIPSCQDVSSLYGTFGDSFGAVNALFSGLALAGVVFTLFMHSEASRRSAKPFLVPKLARGDGAARVAIKGPVRADGSVRLPVFIEIPIYNSSSYVALNVTVKLVAKELSSETTYVVDMPLAPADAVTAQLKLDVVGSKAQRFVDSLREGGVRISIEVIYGSVEGVRWLSGASYDLAHNANRLEDRDLLDAAINGQLAVETQWTAETTVELDFSPVAGSWRYEEQT